MTQSFEALPSCSESQAFQSTLQILLSYIPKQCNRYKFRFLLFPVFFISLFNSWYFPTFSIFFSSTFPSTGAGMLMVFAFCSFLSAKIKSGFFASITLSHWILTSHSNSILSFSTTPSGACLYLFSLHSSPLFQHISQWILLANYHDASCTPSELTSQKHWEFVAHCDLFGRTIDTTYFQPCYQCDTSYNCPDRSLLYVTYQIFCPLLFKSHFDNHARFSPDLLTQVDLW